MYHQPDCPTYCATFPIQCLSLDSLYVGSVKGLLSFVCSNCHFGKLSKLKTKLEHDVDAWYAWLLRGFYFDQYCYHYLLALEGKKPRHREEGRCDINSSWTDGAICGSVKPGSGKEARKKRQLSGADSAWLLVNSSWSQQAGKSLSDKVESFLSAQKEPALWGGQQAVRSASQNG